MAQATYITGTELLKTHDARIVLQLAADDGTPVAAVDADDDPVIVNAIERASAEVEAALLRAGRFTLTSLAAAATDDDWTLKGLVADLAVANLYARRGGGMPDDIRSRQDAARENLKALADGRWIFGTTDAEATAGQPRISIISASQYANRRMVSNSRVFPPRRTELP